MIIRNVFCGLISGLFLLVTAMVHADSIGVNFGTNNGTLGSAAIAGAAPFAQANFNNIQQSFNATALNLRDNNGIATTANLFCQNFGYANFLITPAGADELLNSQCFLGNGTNNWSFTISGIPYATYNLIVYDLADSGQKQGVNVGGTTFYSSSPVPVAAGYLDQNAATPFTYRQATSTVSTAPTLNSDYVVFDGLTGDSQMVNLIGFSASPTSFVRATGFQIVAVPEPATAAIAMVGIFSLGLIRYRRSKPL
jgi:hypothetical protein